MVMESSGESGDGFAVPDVGDGVPCFREMPDVASQRFPRGLMEFLHIIFRARLLTHCHVILNKNSLKIIQDSMEYSPKSISQLLADWESIIGI